VAVVAVVKAVAAAVLVDIALLLEHLVAAQALKAS
jgi:hypothetical protein